MISKEELLKYKMPPKINFLKEENRLREKNIQKLQLFLKTIYDFPSILDDYKYLKPKQFSDKYRQITNNDKIYDDAQNFTIKIENYAKNFNLNIKFLIKSLQTNQLLATNFIVDFKKQNPYEPFVEKYFKFLETDLKLIYNFKHLQVSGPEALYIYNGLICNAEIKENVSKVPPSIDFIWNYTFKDKTMNFYASHKYTHGTGTAQKNQMNDLETFLSHSLQSSNKNHYFIALMDGNYYTNYFYPNFKGENKPIIIEHIKTTKQNDKCKACSSNEFIETVIDLIKKWLKNNFADTVIIEELEKLNILLSKVRKQH